MSKTEAKSAPTDKEVAVAKRLISEQNMGLSVAVRAELERIHPLLQELSEERVPFTRIYKHLGPLLKVRVTQAQMKRYMQGEFDWPAIPVPRPGRKVAKKAAKKAAVKKKAAPTKSPLKRGTKKPTTSAKKAVPRRS